MANGLGFDSKKINALVDRVIRDWHAKERRVRSWKDAERLLALPRDPMLETAASVARINTYQWHEEDKARDVNATNKIIADIKRSIDVSNQRRVNEIERFDQNLEALLHARNIRQKKRAPLNSETPGSLVDRLTIVGLKLYHMKEQASRKNLTAGQRRKFAERVRLLKEQRADLSECLDRLLKDVRAGRRRFKTYFQFKMYNDPETNPFLRSKKKAK
jgi:hypothetical protein